MATATKAQQEYPASDIMFASNIARIAHSPFAKTKDGIAVVNVLRRLHTQRKIAYGDTTGSRGWWDGTILINGDYYGKICQTIPTLVHEASHATWHTPRRIVKNSIEDLVADEFRAQLNELILYEWLRDEQQLCGFDSELDMRVKRRDEGTLRSVIEQNFREERTPVDNRGSSPARND